MNRCVSSIRSKRLFALCAVTSAIGVWSSPSRAQSASGFALNRFEPSETGSEWFANDTLDLRGKIRPALGLVLDYGYKPYVLVNSNGDEVNSIVSDQLFVHVGGSLVLFDRLRLGVSLPVAITQGGDANGGVVNGQRIVGGTSGGVGDLRIGADLRLLGTYGDAFTLALGGRVWAPTGDQSQFLGDNGVRIGPHLAAAGDIGAFAYAASLGATYRANDQTFAGHPAGSQVDFGLAMGVRAAEKKLLIGPELYGSTNVTSSSAFLDARTTPLGLLGSLHYTAGDVRFGLGAGPGLSHTAGTSQFRGLASFEYAPSVAQDAPPPPSDRDGDRIVDTEDACPDVAGIRTDDPKTNGCPSDRDHDAIVDTEDACPDVAGVRTGDPKTNGCPSDRDKDGVVDMVDACPDVAGIKTDDPKTSGCPDRDSDGIVDAIDACPDVAGVKTDDPKTNGCPSDRDHDGIPDTIDACPDAAGPASSDPKKNGCPIARIEAGQVKIVEQIKFKTGSNAILPESQPVIDAVAKILGEHKEITFLRVEGHTDNVGKAQMNKVLSDKRAASVVAALVKAGVAKSRLANEGFGLERPLVPNDTEEGRTANRRVEFHIAGAGDSDHAKTKP